MNDNNASNTNTILIVVVLVILVAFGVWWFTAHRQVAAPTDTANTPTQNGVNIEVTP